MRLKHKNTSNWAKPKMKLGLNTLYVNTRLAISEQLHKHQLLTMKQTSMGSSSDENCDAEDDYSGSDGEETSAVLQKAKESTDKVLKEDGEAPKSGVLSLPFMVRGLTKRREALVEEAEGARQEYVIQINNLESRSGVESPKLATPKGRRVFGKDKSLSREVKDREAVKRSYVHGDDEEEPGVEDKHYEQKIDHVAIQEEVQVDPEILLEESDNGHSSVFKIPLLNN